MPASRRLRLALEIALGALVVTLAAYGVSAGLRLAADDVDSIGIALPIPSTPARYVPGPLDSYAVIAARDVFNPTPDGDRQLTDGLRLWGVGLHGARGHAVIEDRETGRQELYRVGDTLRGARVATIAWDRVTLERGSTEATLALASPGERRDGARPAEVAAAATPPTLQHIRRTGADAYVVDRRELAGAVDNMSGLMTELRAVAETAEGRPAGFRVFQIKEDSLFRRLGLLDGDVVQRVNGAALEDPASLLAFLDRLRNEPRVAVDIVRAGRPRTLVYDLR